MFGMLSQHRNQLNQSGSGLGLSISKKIVESLGGEIKVKSHQNRGSKFTFTIKINNEQYNSSLDQNDRNQEAMRPINMEECKEL